MSSGLDAGAGSHDQSVYADKSSGGEGLSTAGGAQDQKAGLASGLDAGPGGEDKKKGLSEGLSAGPGSNDLATGGGHSGFDAGTDGHKSGGGVTLDGGAGEVDREGAPGLGDKLKSLKDKVTK